MTRLPAWFALAVLVSCSGVNDTSDARRSDRLSQDRVIFLAQSTRPNAVMDALFDGRIEVDQAGCIRFVSNEPATVVWPKDFSLIERNGELQVRAADGRTIGRLGGNFRFGGGYVNALHSGIDLSSADRQRAASSCPGQFWIVGEVP